MILISWLILQIKNHWEWFVGVLFVAVIVLGFGIQKHCGKKAAKIDEARVQAAQKAIADQDTEKQKQILVESFVAEKEIDQNAADAKTQTVNAIAEAKKKADTMNNQEIATELERRLNP